MFEMFLRNKFYLARQDRLSSVLFQYFKGKKAKKLYFFCPFLKKYIKRVIYKNNGYMMIQ